MSIEAMAHVLNLKVGDSTRKLVLVGFANHAHKDGTEAYAALKTVAEYADCSVRTIQRHLTVLLAEGFMREAPDQSPTGRYPEHLRPIVYEVALTAEDRESWAANHRPGLRAVAQRAGAKGSAAKQAGDNLTPGGGDNLTPGPGDAHDTSPVTPVTQPGDTRVTQTVLEPSTQPSTKTADESAALPGMPGPDAKPVDTPRQIAEAVARGYHDWYAAEVGPPATWRHPALTALIVKALDAGYTRAQVGKALQALRRPLPGAAAWEDTLQALRAGRPVSVQGGRVVASTARTSPEMAATHAARAANWGN